jgi:hypothetical protein
MAVTDQEQIFCKKCKKTMRADEFYGTNNLEKYPNGKLDTCKKCITMHVDNFNPESFLWILQECDVPWVPEAWYTLLEKYGKDRSKLTGMTILGRYLSKMKLKPYTDCRWADTERLQELRNLKTEQAMKAQGYSATEIMAAVEEQRIIIPEGGYQEPEYIPGPATTGGGFPQEDYFAQQSGVDESDLVIDLTDEERRMLLLKWGKAYKPEEWIKLEQLYQEMEESYEIQGAGHEDTLKLVCKTSMKANQLLDIGDVDGAQKMIKMYDGLMKSGKFTAAQNKAETGEYLDSIAELVTICEKDGFIPRFYTDGPKDRVDETLLDLKNYTHSLVVEEMNLGNLIENAVKQMAIEEAKEEDEDNDEEELDYESISELKDEDFEEYSEFLEEEELSDEELLAQIRKGEEGQ